MGIAKRLRSVLLAAVVLALGLGAVVSPIAWEAAAVAVAAVIAVDVARALGRGTLGVDVIALLAIVGAVVLGHLLAAAIIAVMVAGGNALEEYAEARARREVAALVSRTPRAAHRRDGEQLTDIGVDAIRPGDVLVVKPGEVVPVDGVVLTGTATLDESALTGEPLPVTRSAGQDVRSGVVNAGAPFDLRASETAERSTYAAVIRLVQAAEKERPPLVRLADRWALWFLGATLAIGGGAWWWTADPVRALAVLVVATPCPLILAAPIALVCGISRAAHRGIIVKGGGVLERLARVRTALFDKTGTLTVGKPRVTGVEALEGFDPDEVLRCAASLAQVSQHVVSAAIVAAARNLGLRLSFPDPADEIPGGGVIGTIDGSRVVLGSASLLRSEAIPLPTEGSTARIAAAAASVAWVAQDGHIAGAVLLGDRVRPETPRALRMLRTAGLDRLVMVTGDRLSSAEAVAGALGLDAVKADLSPAGKVDCVRAERERAPVVMVGDGINDAPALAAADVGIAMGARGAAAAAETADVVMLLDRLDRVAEAVTIAKRARWIALQSIAVGMGLSGLAMVAAALGKLPPVPGALLQEAIDVAVVLNALRVLVGLAAPAHLTDRGALNRVIAEHGQLRALLDRMRRAAERVDAAAEPITELRAISEAMSSLLLPHQRAEEESIYPELAERLGGRDPTGTMTRMHEEIAHLATTYGALVNGLSEHGPSEREAQEVRRLLHALDAVIALHLAAEEDMLSHVEDLGIAA